MKESAFNPDVGHDPDMCAGCTDHGHKAVTMMTKHAKGGQKRGFFGKGGKGAEPQGGGGGMSSNMNGSKKTGKTKEPMESHGEY
jgi:hypothetical protein